MPAPRPDASFGRLRCVESGERPVIGRRVAGYAAHEDQAPGHGKRAARESDTWLQGVEADRPPKPALAAFEMLVHAHA